MRGKGYIDLTTRDGRQAFYRSREWRQIRELVLTRNPYCESCLKSGVREIATEVDHIVDIRDDPTLSMDISNLQGLCKACHSRKTALSNVNVTMHVRYEPANRKWKF